MRIPALERVLKAHRVMAPSALDRLFIFKKWEESKHPRAANGQFGSGSGGGSSKQKKPEAPTKAPPALSKLTPEQMKTVRAYRKSIKADHAALKKDLRSNFRRKDYKIEARVKKSDSIAEKLRRKPEKYKGDPANLQDISGLRVVAKDQAGLEEAVKKFKSEYGSKIIPKTEDNFYTHPQNPDPGYRAYHATIEINGMPHEVQIKTHNMGIWSECNHPLYKNDEWTKGVGKDPKVQAFMKACAVVYQKRDRGIEAQLPEEPAALKNLDGWSELKKEFGWG